MNTPLLHPAVFRLLRLQSRGRRRRLWRRFCQPQRLTLSVIECVLVVLWLGNAALTTWFREAASPETLRALLSAGFVLYAGWHLTKSALFRVERPFEWTPAERELLIALPLRPRDLLAYQLATVSMTTLVKSGLLTLLLLPELRCAALGLVGLFLVLFSLELFRIAVKIATWAMGPMAFRAYRTTIVSGLIVLAFAACVAILDLGTFGRVHAGEGPLQRLVNSLPRRSASVIHAAALPFRPYLDVILADAMSPAAARRLLPVAACVLMLGSAVAGLYAACCRWVANRDRRRDAANEVGQSSLACSARCKRRRTRYTEFNLPVLRIPDWGGAGALAWRQLVAARRNWGTLLSVLVVPAILAAAPCFLIADRNIVLLATSGSLAFFTLQLLPAALRLDFRRDLGRLTTLKALPLTPAAAAVGQTLCPVLIVTLFQCGVFGIAVVARSLPLHHVCIMMLMMIPLNVVVFSFENLIYLLYPYRMQQEGLEMFFRTMLGFTGKGLLFAVGLGVIATWGFTAAALSREVSEWLGTTVDALTVFTSGMIAGLSFFAAVVLKALSRAYRTFDVTEELAG